MKQIFNFFFLLFFVATYAQENNIKTIPEVNLNSAVIEPIKYDGAFDSLDSSIISQVTKIDFSKKNVIHLLTDNYNHFYLFNLSILEDRFERIYFYKGIVKLNFFIQIDHGLPSNVAWIISENKNENKIIQSQIEKLVTDTKAISMKMSKSEKENWLSNKLN